MSLDVDCISGLCKDLQGFCTACMANASTVFIPIPTASPPAPAPATTPALPVQPKLNSSITREAITSVTTIITTTGANSASSLALVAVTTSVMPALSSGGATGATGRSSSWATSLIPQTQFIAITGQIGGNSSTEEVSALSTQLGWSNYKFSPSSTATQTPPATAPKTPRTNFSPPS
eukprot:767554-Hanusia_phi.AAC.5